MVVGRLLCYWEGNFSGAMLNFGRVPVEDWGLMIAKIDKIGFSKRWWIVRWPTWKWTFLFWKSKVWDLAHILCNYISYLYIHTVCLIYNIWNIQVYIYIDTPYMYIMLYNYIYVHILVGATSGILTSLNDQKRISLGWMKWHHFYIIIFCLMC